MSDRMLAPLCECGRFHFLREPCGAPMACLLCGELACWEAADLCEECTGEVGRMVDAWNQVDEEVS